MSRLALHSRPFVVFDPSNRKHRRWFAEFNHSAKWGNCPVRFVVEDDTDAVISRTCFGITTNLDSRQNG